MEKVEVGYICEKGNGHFSLAGMSDHGACGSHIAGRIYIEMYGDWPDAQQISESLRGWVRDAESAIEREYMRSLEERLK